MARLDVINEGWPVKEAIPAEHSADDHQLGSLRSYTG